MEQVVFITQESAFIIARTGMFMTYKKTVKTRKGFAFFSRLLRHLIL